MAINLKETKVGSAPGDLNGFDIKRWFPVLLATIVGALLTFFTDHLSEMITGTPIEQYNVLIMGLWIPFADIVRRWVTKTVAPSN